MNLDRDLLTKKEQELHGIIARKNCFTINIQFQSFKVDYTVYLGKIFENLTKKL